MSARNATLALLDQRAPGATICPSEVARVLGGADWRGEMKAVHDAVDGLVTDGLIRISWKGVALDRRDGPYRIGGAASGGAGSGKGHTKVSPEPLA